MKSRLLMTTALASAVALAAPLANAAEWDVTIGGFYEQWVGFASFETAAGEDVSDVDVQEDGEIHFKPRITLDNGITFGANVQLEAATSEDQIDQSFLFVRGSFGEVLLGAENGAAYAMHYGVASEAIGLDSGDAGDWIADANGALFTTSNHALRDGESQKIRYITPRFEGFQFGMSYAPEGREDTDGRVPNEMANHGQVPEQIIQAAINYEAAIDDVSIAASLGGQIFGDVNATSDDDAYMVAAGIHIGFGGFKIAVSGSHEENPANGVNDRQVIGGSIGYVSGPMGVSLAAIYGVQDNSGTDEDQISVELGGHYNLGPGVTAAGSIYYINHDTGYRDLSGVAVVGGIALTF
jgi:outer membrane protein OmpU